MTKIRGKFECGIFAPLVGDRTGDYNTLKVNFVLDEILYIGRKSILWSGQAKFYYLLVPGQADFCDIFTALTSGWKYFHILTSEFMDNRYDKNLPSAEMSYRLLDTNILLTVRKRIPIMNFVYIHSVAQVV